MAVFKNNFLKVIEEGHKKNIIWGWPTAKKSMTGIDHAKVLRLNDPL